MKRICTINGAVALFTLLLNATGDLSASATSVKSATTSNSTQESESNAFQSQENFHLAQADLIGQCRAAKRRIFVYTERSTTSQTIRTLAPNEEVTLAGQGSGGWIAISSPETGYVQAMDLKLCQNGERPDPDSASNLCRRVTVAQGLAVRRNPSPSAERVGGIFMGNLVRLASPPRSEKDSQGRTWIQITQPVNGWISSGFPDGNLGPQSPCP